MMPCRGTIEREMKTSMTRRAVLAFTLAALLSLVAWVESESQGQRTGRTWRIGWLSPSPSATGSYELAALREGLRGLGYVEGERGNILLTERWADGAATRMPQLARELVEAKVDVICTSGTPATLHAKQATATIPIVFGRAAFPERTGLVASMARPGGNLTGVTFIGPEYGKRLELLREVSPRVSRVALLHNDQNAASVMAVEETRKWAATLQVTIEAWGVHDRASLEAAFAGMSRIRPDALMTTADPLLASYRVLVVEFAREQRLISMYGDREYVKAGGLMFYGTSISDMWRHAAIHVDQILRGAKPRDLPVEQPKKFELIINTRTSRSLGLTIPSSVLLRADQIVE